jgi:short subunit dehydrogenase-like uncharacterized protein
MVEQRRFDLIVFGASGFTGKHVVKYLSERVRTNKINWALAGRSRAKLAQVASDLGLGDLALIEADVGDEVSLRKMCAQTRLVINCVGPFRFYGEPVVRACIAEGCDYVDITGEPEFIERMVFEYGAEAKSRGVTIVPACGFDCIPSEMGVVFIKKECAKMGVVPSGVEMFFQLLVGPKGGKGNYGTYETAVHSVANMGGIRKYRQEVKQRAKLATLPRIGPKLRFTLMPHWETRLNRYVFPFLFADPSVVRLSQQLLYGEEVPSTEVLKRPVQFTAYVALNSLFLTILTTLFFVLFGLLAQIPFTRRFLLEYPELCTGGMFGKTGPTEEQIKTCGFISHFFVTGYRHNKTDSEPDFGGRFRVSGPEIGYATTSICVAESALTLLRDKSSSKLVSSGVMTPGAAFAKTDLIEHLQKGGLKFEMLAAIS